MATQAEVLIAALFRPTAGGWVYRAPNPWIFGRPTHYLVNDTQRSQIIQALTQKRPMLLVYCLATLVGGWIALFTIAMRLEYRFEHPTALELLIMLMLIIAPAFGAIAVNAAAMRNRISGVLATSQVTQETITYREMRATAARQQPKRSKSYFMGMGALWAFMAAVQSFRLIERQSQHPLGSDALSYFIMLILILAICLAITHFIQALRSSQDAHRLG